MYAPQRRGQKPQHLPGASISDQQPAPQENRYLVGIAGSACNIDTADLELRFDGEHCGFLVGFHAR